MSADDRLRQRLAALPPNRKSVVTDEHGKAHLGIGVPPDPPHRLPVGDVLPDALDSASFLDTSDEQPDLIRALVDSRHAQTLTRVMVGNSSFGTSGHGCDYVDSVAALRGADLPNLRDLDLGEWVLFSNSETLYGSIGDVTEVLAPARHVEVLGLRGHFELTRSFTFDRLVHLEIWSTSTIAEPLGGEIEPASIARVLASEMPRLGKLIVHPYCASERTREAFPEEFLSGACVPKLSGIEVVGDELDATALDLLLSSELLARPGLGTIIEDVPDAAGMDEVRRRHAERSGVTWKVTDGGAYHEVRTRA